MKFIFCLVLASVFINLGAKCISLGDLPVKRTDDGRIVCRNEITGDELDWY